MLERYFIKPETVDRIRGAWLGEPIERYVSWLTELDYSPRNVYRRVPLLLHFGEFAWKRGARRWEELPSHVEGFVIDWCRSRGKHRRGKQGKQHVASEAANPIWQMLELILPGCGANRYARHPEPFVQQAPAFWLYLREERGLRPASVALYVHNLRRFESYLKTINLLELHALSPTVLSSFVIDAAQALAKESLSGLCSHLRVFLSYLHGERLTTTDLSVSVDCPRVYRLSKLPRSILWEDIQKLLTTVERRTPIGKRDYAILLLLITYGLRAREVAALTLDSIDWKRERLQVPERKAGHSTAFPLSTIAGEAIVDYLQHGRPRSAERVLFLRTTPPHGPVNWQVISQRTTRYLRKANIRVHRPGSHSLRHTCVQRLVDAQFSLKEIGDYVGHRHPKSTEVYTKVDIESLRDVALGEGEHIL
jgi:integrase/recombinase XerD